MFLYLKSCILLIFLINQVVSNWRLVDYSFTEDDIYENNWKMRDDCDSSSDSSFQQEACGQNQLSYVSLKKSRRLLLKSFNYKSYQVQVILDVFFGFADDNKNSWIKVLYDSNIASENEQQLYKRDYKDDDLTQNSIRICNDTSSSSRFELKTIVSTIGNSNTNSFTIKICVDPEKDYMRLGIRNILIFANTCHPTCLTCNGPLETNCLTCFNAQSLSGGKCKCISNQQFSETYLGCRQECERDNSIARYDKICVEDKRIKSKFTLFENNNIPQSNYYRYSPLVFQEDKFHTKNTDLIYENCNGISFIGKFQFSEGMIYQMSLENVAKFLRIRMTFYFFDFQDQSKIEILYNGQQQSRIIKDSSNFQFENLIPIFQENGNCIDSYTLIRIEMIFQLYDTKPVLTIQGQLQFDYESWGLRNITVDTGFCQENCLVCSDFSKCSQCITGYKLYKNMCVQTCPVYSTNCVDYEDLIPYSRYLVKGFYDLNMTIDDIDTFYDDATDSSKNYATGQKFSFLNKKIVLGGILVWNDGSYKKTWTISDPHYAVTVYFNITYGDEYSGQFTYKIGSSSDTFQGPFNYPGGGSNLVGRTFKEKTVFFNQSLPNFQNNNLYIEFKCDVGTANITKEFCAISEYFIVVHYCRPFCSSCTSLNVCTGTTSNCGVTQYLYFNSTTETYSCKDCNQPGCSTCTSAEICTQCLNTQFYLQNGICLCKPFTFYQVNTCVQCNKYCENCYGNSKYNCLTCVEDYHRAISKNQCLCQPGYYDDGINLPCLPICGDQIVVDQEDCDDGNYNPFDGCHNCKFACNFACDICFNGRCYACKSGYELYSGDCRSICQNKSLTLLQQCNENTRNCVNCQYECSINCIDCHFGICLQCNENAGWYAQMDGTCNSICGDGIIVNLTERCDDGNSIPFDGCNFCEFQCDTYCLTCIKSECLSCQNGYQLIENRCFAKCQDQILVYPEQCEDGNITQYDGCFNCKFQCSIYCIDCQFGICQQCDELNGWYLQSNGTCQSVCGDNITVHEVEECDNNTNLTRLCNQCQYVCEQNCLECNKGLCSVCIDGYQLLSSIQKCIQVCDNGTLVKDINIICEDNNNLQYDGCYSCQISCQSSCTLCTLNGCQECNNQGWKLNEQQYKCEPICGDGIIIQNVEECDDLINQNCYQCKYICQDSCLICHKGNCLKCQKGWQLDFEKKCYPTSGDSFVVGNEQCDDYNFIMNDGCYLSYFQCQQSCLNCQFGNCIQCEQGYWIIDDQCYEILNDGYSVGNEQCDDMNFQGLDGCFNGQFDCPEDCEYCYKGLCLRCIQESKQLDQINNYCQSFCGDGYLSNDEQCDDANNIPYDGCHQCKFQCNDYCHICNYGQCLQCYLGYELDTINNTCQSICGDGIVAHDEQCDYGDLRLEEECYNCKLQCQEQCIKCVDGQCFQCYSPGWELNSIDMKCYPFCGDQLVQGNEQCDDGNNEDDDGCVECQFNCQQQCTLCNISDCLECDVEGWQLYINRCYPICGDKLVLGKEECDDGNLIPYDGCYECKFQCQEQCVDCVKGICNSCIDHGWELNQNHVCTTKCGDGITIDEYEQCDDGNDIPYDGCYQCEFQCEQLCTLCQQGVCFECNQLGWIIKNNQCTSICGDGIVVGNEQCDDMNSIQNDGCYECKFQCDQYCIDCQEGICNECLQGMHQINQICQPVCGDGFHLQPFEQCDDGNKESGDGCDFQCKIEKDWLCITNINFISVCLISKQPDFTITVLTPNPQETFDIQIQFNQQVKISPKIQNDLNDHITASIINLEQENYSIQQTKGTTSSQNELTDIVLQYRILFLSSIEHPVFQIEFHNDPIISEYNQTLTKSQGKIELATPIVLGQTEAQIAEQASDFNQAIIISLASLSSVCLLTGQSDIFWNLMDQLQYLSYVKYINIDFSPNLNIYFEVFKFVTISPLMSAIGIDKLFAALDGSENYLVVTKYKFLKDDINAYFLINFQSFLFCFLATYLSFYSAKILHHFLKKIGHIEIKKLGFQIGKLVISTRKTLQLKISEFYYNAILRLLLSNSYDLSFACAIQLAYYPKTSNTILIINYYLSFLVYVGVIVAIIYIINISSTFSKQNTLRNRSKYQAIFDGIKDNNKMWTFQYNSLLLIKKLIFISSIVFLQDNAYIQVIAISFLQSLFLIHFILNKPLDDRLEYFKTLITEVLIILNVISFLLYQYKNEIDLKPEKVILLGWMHIFSFSSILAVTFILDSSKQIKKLFKLIREALKKPERPQKPMFYGCN
ncbi:unnamed protein product [Paramecium primaurelia]|uniref:EGF-like domain-containing protein n=1 Tax=Paramecium primaurelia TaxID=5886 RepID=A0A8S1NB88_PARPR|nr:unnamed protein product [Paramecium primaurelia]